MPSSPSVKEVLVAVFDQYKKFFEKTFSLCLLLSVFVFVSATLLFKFSNTNTGSSSTPDSLLRCFYSRYSSYGFYNIVDLSKSVYLAFTACFAISYFRSQKNNGELSSGFFLKNFSVKDAVVVLFLLVIVGISDPIFYFLDGRVYDLLDRADLAKWTHNVFWELRIYFPVAAFAFAIGKLTWGKKISISQKSIFVLLAIAFMFNEFTYELTNLIRTLAFHLITMMFSNDNAKFLVESILGIPLLACYFIGFATVMALPLKSIQKE